MTMIGLPKPADSYGYVDKVSTEDLAVKAETLDVIEVDGKQYAQLPEGWPAAEDKDLEEAHAEAVASDDITEDEIMSIYASFTPAEVRGFCEDWVRLINENTALRKGMKTMQRKTRKQNQQQRRLARRLAQARAGREQLRDQAEQYRDIAKINQGAALELSLQQLRAGETVEL